MKRRLYRFGQFSIDVAAREIFRDEMRVSIRPRVFECIAYLIEHRDRAVGRDELISAVWGKTDIADAALGKIMLTARRALDDDAESQRVIRTVARFGYRWVTDTTVDDTEIGTAVTVPVDAALAAAPVVERTPQPARSRRRWTFAVAVSSALVLIGVGWYARTRVARNPVSTVAPNERRLVAVLPFDVTGSPDDAWLRLGMMDLLVSRLRQAGLAVIPSEAVVRVVPDGASTDEARQAVATAAQPSVLVAPSARRVGTQWLLRAETSGASGNRSRDLEVRADDAVAAGGELANRLADLLGAPRAEASANATPLQVAQLMQRTRAAQLTNDLAGAARMIEAAPPAVRDSPELRLRGATLALRAGHLDDAQQRFEALLGGVTAEGNPVLRGRILTGLGTIASRRDQLDNALRALDEALRLLAPTSDAEALGDAHVGHGTVMRRLGRLDEAVADYARARVAYQLDGDDLGVARVDAGEAVMVGGRNHYADAVLLLERAVARFERMHALSELLNTEANLVRVQLVLLRPDAALAASDRGMAYLKELEDAPIRHFFLRFRVAALAAAGRVAEARALATELLGEISPGDAGLVLAGVRSELAALDLQDGQFDTAATLAQQAVDGFSSPDTRKDRSWASRLAIRSLRAGGHAERAAAATEALLQWTLALPASPPPVAATLALVEGDPDPASALTRFGALLHEAEDDGVPLEMATVAGSFGARLIDAGEVSQATDVIGRTARFADHDFNSALMQVRLYRALGKTDAWRNALRQALDLAGERAIPAALQASAIDAATTPGSDSGTAMKPN